MNQLPTAVTPPAPRKRKRKKGIISRSSSGRDRKTKRANATTATFPADPPVSPNTAGTNPIPPPQVKRLRNRADYATRKCVKKGDEVMRLKDDKLDLIEIQKNQHEDAQVTKQLMTRLEEKLSSNEIASSKLASTLKGRAARLSASLSHEKEKGRLIKKVHKDNVSSLQDEMKGALIEKESDMRNMKILHHIDKDKASERVRAQGRNRADALRQQLQAHVKQANVNGEKRLMRSQKASSAARERLKVSVLLPSCHFNVLTHPVAY